MPLGQPMPWIYVNAVERAFHRASMTPPRNSSGLLRPTRGRRRARRPAALLGGGSAARPRGRGREEAVQEKRRSRREEAVQLRAIQDPPLRTPLGLAAPRSGEKKASTADLLPPFFAQLEKRRKMRASQEEAGKVARAMRFCASCSTMDSAKKPMSVSMLTSGPRRT